jgi:hypothetical protein
MINALVPLMLRVVEEDTPTCDKSGGVCVWGGGGGVGASLWRAMVERLG